MNAVRMVQVMRGLATFVPGARAWLAKSALPSTPRYCYAVWLRHLVLASRRGLNADPASVAEIGPGDSIGAGIAALLTGAEQYSAFDAVPDAHLLRDIGTLDALVELFGKRTPIPDHDEFPLLWPRLDRYGFPNDLLTPSRMKRTLAVRRIARIRTSLRAPEGPASMVAYHAPWGPSVVAPGTVDFLFSQATLQYLDDPASACRTFHAWLRPGGVMSHEIDLTSLGVAATWNGHWTCDDITWQLVRGNRPYFLNRLPLSAYLAMQRDAGFEIAGEDVQTRPSSLRRADLSRRFRAIADTDLTSAAVLIQSVKRGH